MWGEAEEAEQAEEAEEADNCAAAVKMGGCS